MATFWAISAHSVEHMLSLYFDYLLYQLFHVLILRVVFGF